LLQFPGDVIDLDKMAQAPVFVGDDRKGDGHDGMGGLLPLAVLQEKAPFFTVFLVVILQNQAVKGAYDLAADRPEAVGVVRRTKSSEPI